MLKNTTLFNFSHAPIQSSNTPNNTTAMPISPIKPFIYSSLYIAVLVASQQAAALDLEQELTQQWQQQLQNKRIAQLETYRQKVAALDEAQFTTYKQPKQPYLKKQ